MKFEENIQTEDLQIDNVTFTLLTFFDDTFVLDRFVFYWRNESGCVIGLANAEEKKKRRGENERAR